MCYVHNQWYDISCAILYDHECSYIGLHVKYSLFLSDFNKTLIFSTYFRKLLKYQIPSKSVQWEPSCSMRTDELKYRRDDANSRFSQFC